MSVNVAATYADAVEIIFVDNVNDSPIDLIVPDLADARDLFYFAVDLLMKGLVRLYGTTDRRLEVGAVTPEQFGHACRKLRNAGVVCDLVTRAALAGARPGVHFETPGDPGRLSGYELVVQTLETSYHVRFDLLLTAAPRGTR